MLIAAVFLLLLVLILPIEKRTGYDDDWELAAQICGLQ